ncbi:hypothetical protein SUDANB58_00053 [Streptomyces sp. enrichment culture]|uniref:alpha/beta hydrolase n=1 Tax=Streptomyces sp. enrichment culture TaxID=1795815 RepID=UPI003F54B016
MIPRVRRPALLCVLAATAATVLPAAPARAAAPPPALSFGACPAPVPAPPAPDRVECARMSVPPDWDAPRGPRIELAVSRVRASGTRPSGAASCRAGPAAPARHVLRLDGGPPGPLRPRRHPRGRPPHLPAGARGTRRTARGGLGPAEFDRAVYRALGRTERWAGLADGLAARLRDGGVDGLRPADPFDGPASRTYEAANRIVKCADGPGPAPRRIVADIRRTSRLGPQSVLIGMEASACAYWHHRPTRRTPLGSPDAPPVLLVASAHDPVTPVEGAHRPRRTLPGSRPVVLDDDHSHGVFAGRSDTCVDGTVAACLLDGTVPAADVRCAGPGLPPAP